MAIFKENFLNIYRKLEFSSISEMKWAKSEEKSEFGVGGFDSLESVPPSRNPSPPQSKLRGDAPASKHSESLKQSTDISLTSM